MVSLSPEVISVEDSIAQRIKSIGREGRMKIVHNAKYTIFYFSNLGKDEGYSVNKSRNLCWKLFSVVVSYGWDLPENDMCIVQCRTRVT